MLTTPTLNPTPTPTPPTPPRAQNESAPGQLVTEPAAQATGAQFPLFLLMHWIPQLPAPPPLIPCPFPVFSDVGGIVPIEMLQN